MPNFDTLEIGSGYQKYIDKYKGTPFSNLIDELAELQGMLNYYTQPDKNNGNIVPFLDEKDKASLLEEYLKVKNELHEIKTNIDEYTDGEDVTFLDDIEKALDGDTHSLTNYDPSKGYTSLSHIFEQNQKIKVDISDVMLGKVGGNQSSRIPFKYTAPDGRKYDGFFTEPVYFNPVKTYEDQRKSLTKQDPMLPVLLDAVREALKNKFLELAKDPSNSLTIQRFISRGGSIGKKIQAGKPESLTDEEFLAAGMSLLGGMVESRHGIRVQMPALMTIFNTIAKKGNEEEKKAASHFLELNKQIEYAKKNGHGASQKVLAKFNSLGPLAQALGEMYNTFSLQLSCGIDPGSRIESRNAALSSVASLLGKPDLVAKSIPMTIVRGGKEIQGTFMATAEGIDPNHRTEENLHIGQRSLSNSIGVKAMADLQVIDFICGNIDRHGGNFFYQYDKKTNKITSVTGIDNDLSFGTYVPEKEDTSLQSLSSLKNMKVFSLSMAKEVTSLTKERLMQTLSPYDLTEAQKEACWQRTEKLQAFIKKNMDIIGDDFSHKAVSNLKKHNEELSAMIIKDEDFTELNLQKLMIPAPKDKTKKRDYNIFTYSASLDKELLDEKAGKEKTEVVLKGDKYGAHAVDEYFNFATESALAMQNATNSRGSSKQFDNLKEAFAKLAQYENDIRGKMMTELDVRLHNNQISHLITLADAYLQHHEEKFFKSGYAKSRADLVTDLKKDLQEKLIVLSPKDINTIHEQEERDIAAAGTKIRVEAMKTVLKAQLNSDINDLSIHADDADPKEFREALERQFVHSSIIKKFSDKDGNLAPEKYNDVLTALKRTDEGVEYLKTTEKYDSIIKVSESPELRKSYIEKLKAQANPEKEVEVPAENKEMTKEDNDIMKSMGM